MSAVEKLQQEPAHDVSCEKTTRGVCSCGTDELVEKHKDAVKALLKGELIRQPGQPTPKGAA
jgi:hypothetical protein